MPSCTSVNVNEKRAARHRPGGAAWREPSLLSAGGYVFASCDVAFVSCVRLTTCNHYFFEVGLRSGRRVFSAHTCPDVANDAYGRFTSELHQALGL